jgi:hypothetical protein
VCGEWTDILSFHDYSPNRTAIRSHLQEGLAYGRCYGKPILVSEIACLARASPYDVAIETCQDLGIGWYVWELMIGVSRWRGIHGIVYPDGTVRDPSVVAAVRGFFRRRTGELVRPELDKEGAATRVLKQAEDWARAAVIGGAAASYADGLRILEEMANLLECAEAVAMVDLPSVQVLGLARAGAEDPAAVCRLLAEWGQVLRRYTD